DTGLRYGKKGNEGTRYVLLPVGGRTLFCSLRINDNGPEFVGRLGSLGGTEEEAVRRINAKAGGGVGNMLPFMLQGVRSLWVDTAGVLLAVVGCLGGAGWLLAQVLLSGRNSRSTRRRIRERVDDPDLVG